MYEKTLLLQQGHNTEIDIKNNQDIHVLQVIINSEKHTLVQKIFQTYKREPRRQKINFTSFTGKVLKACQHEVMLNYILLSCILAEWSIV